MRLAAILGVFVFGALTMLFFRLARQAYQKEKEGEMLMHPAWTGMFATFLLFILMIICLIYALGLWDSFTAWLHQGTPQPVVVKQF